MKLLMHRMSALEPSWFGVLVAVVYLAVTASTSAQPIERMADHEFEVRVARAIYDLRPSDRTYFSLSRIIDIRKPPEERNPVPIRFYGSQGFSGQLQQFTKVSCEKDVRFFIFSESSKAGEITVAVCPNLATNMEQLIWQVTDRLRELVEIIKNPPYMKPNTEVVRSLLRYEKTTVADRIEVHYFPLITLGHGALLEHTVLVVEQSNIVAVQGSDVCLPESTSAKFDDKACADPKASFRKMALLIYQELYERTPKSP